MSTANLTVVAGTMLQTMYARAVYSQKPGSAFYKVANRGWYTIPEMDFMEGIGNEQRGNCIRTVSDAPPEI